MEESLVDIEEEAEPEMDLSAIHGNRIIAAAPSRKKARISAEKQTRTSNVKNLSSLLDTMPLDILYEIFGHLHPKDLINLSRTSKPFRATLMTKNATSIWRRAREGSVLPACPSDRSEPAWAVLFYSNTCGECGGKNVQRVDFLLRRRLCKSCRKDIFIESRFKGKYPGVDKSVLELICYSDARGLRNSGGPPKSTTRYFWPPDVDDMIHELTAFETDIKRGRAGAEKRLQKFKEERKKLIRNIHSNALENEHCLCEVVDEHREEEYAIMKENDALIQKRRSAISKRLTELGYTEADISFVSDSRELNTKVQLTDNIWKRIRPILESVIIKKKRIKAEELMASVKRSRRAIVDRFYDTYRKSLRPSQGRYFPRTCDLCEFGPFLPLVDAPSDTKIMATDFEPFFRTFPEILASYAQQKLKHFRKLLSAGSETNNTPEDNSIDISQPEELTRKSFHDIDPLTLAASVFECCGDPDYGSRHGDRFILIGLDHLLSHQCQSRKDGLQSAYNNTIKRARIDFVPTGAEFARSLVRLAGFDPTTALASEMDEADLRFGCNRCGPETEWDSFRREWIPFCAGYNWRAAIIHSLRGRHKEMSLDVDEPWSVLSQEDTFAVKGKERETYEGYHRSPRWMCDHCFEFMNKEGSRPTIIQHLRDKHGLTDPKEPEDLFFISADELLLNKYTYPVSLPVTAPRP